MGLAAAGYQWPPNGLIRLIDPVTGLPCKEAPFRLQHFISLSMDDLITVGIYYGFDWNPNLWPVAPSPPPYHTRAEMIDQYKAFIGANSL